jgi:hypothetical protein
LKDPAVVDHETPALLTSFATAAVKFSGCPTVRPPRIGVRVTLTLLAATVIVALAERVLSLTEIAVRETVGGVGMLAGAL